MADDGFEREGELLVVRPGTVLPDRCIATGVPTGGNAVHRKLAWVPEWTLALCVLVSPLFGLLAMAITRKSASLTYFVAPAIHRRRRLAVRTSLASFAASAVAFAAGLRWDVDGLLVTALVLLAIGLIALDGVGRPFRVHRITRDGIYLRVRPAFWSNT